jgi:hypothetical protein
MKKLGFILIAALASLGLAGCDHYNCSSGATFGSTCTAGNPGIGGTTSGGTALAYPFFVDTLGTVDGYTLTATTFGPTANYTAPTIPIGDVGAGMVVAQNQFLYTVFPSTQQIFGWSIDSTGNLTAISGTPLSLALTIPTTLAYNLYQVITNPAGTLLFIANPGSTNQIYVYQIGSGGVLTAAPGSPFTTTGIVPLNMGMDGLGKFLYVTSSDGTLDHLGIAIGAYSVSSTGQLTAVAGSPFTGAQDNMFYVQGDPSGNYLIGMSGEDFIFTGVDDANLYVFAINSSSGAIAPVSGSPFPTTYAPFNIAVQPASTSGAFIYSFSYDDNAESPAPNPVEGYQLDATTGAVTAVSGSPFTATNDSLAPWGNFDPSGAYLFFDSNNSFVPYTVSSTGGITQLVPTGTNSSGYWAVADPQ